MRLCGECTACCSSIAVHDMDKKTNEKCIHVGNGCAIYKNRPECCRQFHCAWLLSMTGFKEESMRPDRCGVVGAVGPTEHGMGMYFYNVWEGATDEDRIQSVMRLYNSNFPMLLVAHEGNKGSLFEAKATHANN